jgi:hypothetical protein
MSSEFSGLIFAVFGTFFGALIQYYFQRHSAARQERREIIEVHLLQLQNAAESLYYRMNNQLDWEGKSVMGDEYFRTTSLYIIGRILAQESLLTSQGVYAKLGYDERFKRQLKTTLHAINSCMDDQRFLHYYRVQLAEMLIRGNQVVTYTEFLSIRNEERYAAALTAAGEFVASVSKTRLENLRVNSKALVSLLEAKTKVPSALTLATTAVGMHPGGRT